jgi:sugar phosphate isomerase/epimerase
VKVSATSVILPDLDVVETCNLLQRLGYDGVEWRVRYTPKDAKGYTMWGAHKSDLSPDNIGERAAEVRRITEDHGLGMPIIASNVTADDLETIRKLADGAARLGGVPVRIGAPSRYNRTRLYEHHYQEAIEAYGKALEVLRAEEQSAIIEIHGGTIMVSASLAYRIVSQFSPQEIGVIYDVNNMAKDGFETFRIGMELLGPYMKHCHAGGWRPAPGERRRDGTLDWTYEGCDLAESILDIPQFVADLNAVGYTGFVSIEDFRPIDHEHKLATQIQYLRTLSGSEG